MDPEQVRQRLTEVGAFDEVDRLDDAIARGENPFTDAQPVEVVIERIKRRQLIETIGRATSERYREVLDKLAKM